MNEERGKFLSRWSRRKIEARRAEEEAKPAGPREACVPAVPPSGACDPAAPSTPLPPIEELRGLASEYRDFLRPEVDEGLRRTALKKLFQDPHFNVMDGLDTYIDDYTKADPIPEAMLRTLNQAQGLLFEREEKRDAHSGQHAGTDAVLKQPETPDTASVGPGATGDEDAAQPDPDNPSAAA
jgi:hypothetical protein